jgi:hypothetical protein
MDLSMLQDAVEDAGLEERALTTGYSGRGMYGKTCFAVTGDVQDFGKFLLAVADHDNGGHDTAQDLANAVRTDSMGRQTVFYFPGFPVNDDQSEEDGS